MATAPGDTPGAEDAAAPHTSASEAGRSARGALWLATNGIVVKTSQTVVLLTLAAALAPDALGLVALSTVVVNAASLLAGMGSAGALVYWRGDVERAARTAVSIGLLTSVVLAAVIWAVAPVLSRLLGAGADGVPVVRGLVVTLPFVAVATVTNELLRRRLAFLRRIVPDATASVVGAVVAIVLVAHGEGVMALVVGQVVQAVLALLLAWCVHPPVRPGWSRADARALLAYGAPLSGGNLLELVQLNVDYLVVSVVLGTTALGQYSLAYRIAFVPYLMLAVMATGAAYPYLCRLRGARLAAATTSLGAMLATVLTPLCLGLVLVADHVTLLGDTWADAVRPLALLAAYAWLLSLGLLVLTALNAAGRPGVSMTLRLTHLLLLALALALVASRGIVAVALAQVVVALILLGAGLAVARTLLPGLSLRTVASRLRAPLAAAAVMTLAVLALRAATPGSGVSVAGLVVAAGVGLVAYALPLWLLDRGRLLDAVRLVRGGGPDGEPGDHPGRTRTGGPVGDLESPGTGDTGADTTSARTT